MYSNTNKENTLSFLSLKSLFPKRSVNLKKKKKSPYREAYSPNLKKSTSIQSFRSIPPLKNDNLKSFYSSGKKLSTAPSISEDEQLVQFVLDKIIHDRKFLKETTQMYESDSSDSICLFGISLGLQRFIERAVIEYDARNKKGPLESPEKRGNEFEWVCSAFEAYYEEKSMSRLKLVENRQNFDKKLDSPEEDVIESPSEQEKDRSYRSFEVRMEANDREKALDLEKDPETWILKAADDHYDCYLKPLLARLSSSIEYEMIQR